NIYSARKDFDAASKAYLRVALLYDHHELTPESLFKAAQCLEKAGKSTEAMEFYKELIEKYPDSSYAARAREMIGVT
ncbi:MAG: tetratricopeptide repeat protein, partial [Candidatus Hydrogenedentes bacterium]|nr:tetratricopeptide repeat protein [Candidatus Hydrogenedentota bacterium]